MGSWTQIERSEMVDYIIESPLSELRNDPSFTASTEDLSMALVSAVSTGNYDKTLFLLKQGADPNFGNHAPICALANLPTEFGGIEGSVNCFELLVEFGATLDPGQNALNRAVDNKNYMLVERMLESGLVKEILNGQAFIGAARNDDQHMLHILENHFPIEEEAKCEAFCCACEDGCMNAVDHLVKTVDRDLLKHDAVERCAYFGEIESIKHLVETHNFSINKYDNSALLTAISAESDLRTYMFDKLDNAHGVTKDEGLMDAILMSDPALLEVVTTKQMEQGSEVVEELNDKVQNEQEIDQKREIDNDNEFKLNR